MSNAEEQVGLADKAIDVTLGQDEAPIEAEMRAKRAREGKPKAADLTAEQINAIAVKEFKEQSKVRGPITPPEWPGVALYCRRNSAEEQAELVDIHSKHGINGVFCYRALNSKGERIFTSVAMFEDSMVRHWNVSVVERVCGEMARLCKTQLTDEELGNF